MDLSSIDAIIFDNDGVLVDSETIHLAVELELLAEMGLSYDHAAYLQRFVGLSNADYRAELNRDHHAAFGTPFPEDFGARLYKKVWPRIETELQPLPGVATLVSRYGGPVAVASSAPTERLRRKLELTGLQHLFAPHIYSSDHVENGKPAPDLFFYAASQLNVAPDRCMVIEDSVNGVRAGRAAGMLTVGFTGGGHIDRGHARRLEAAGAHIVVNTHDALLAYLAKD